MDYKYRVIRSDRKTLGISITPSGDVLVRAPRFLPEDVITVEVSKADSWIQRALKKYQDRPASGMSVEIDSETEKLLKKQASEVVFPIVERYSKLMRVSYTGIKITSARTRYGSCNGKNSLCFSFRLMLYPIEAIEAVVVHELAHIKYKNHGKNFYSFIYSVLPDYDERKRLLK